VHVHEKSLRAKFQNLLRVIEAVMRRNKFAAFLPAIFIGVDHHARVSGALQITLQHLDAHRPARARRRIRPDLQNAFRVLDFFTVVDVVAQQKTRKIYRVLCPTDRNAANGFYPLVVFSSVGLILLLQIIHSNQLKKF